MKDDQTIRISILPSQGIHANRLTYIIEYINDSPFLPPLYKFQINSQRPDIRIGYGKVIQEIESTIPTYHIPAQQLFLTESVSIISTETLHANPYQFEQRNLFSVENKKQGNRPFLKDFTFGFDLFEMLFFHLTRYEEAHAPSEQKDRHGYLIEKHHFLCRHHLQKIPVVDQVVYAFLSSLDLETSKIASKINLSHDLDAVRKFPTFSKFLRGVGSLVFRQRKISLLPKYIRQYLQTSKNAAPDPYDTFSWFFLDNHAKKHLFVMAGGNSKYEGFYNLTDIKVRELLKQAMEKNYIIGLHPSYHAITDDQLLIEQKSKLEKLLVAQVTHSRQHFLRFNILETPLQLLRCGIKNDYTMGYQNIIGFRAGTGLPYYWYSLKKEKKINLVENPFVVMDTALVAELKGNKEKMIEAIETLLSEEYWNTALGFNFHNSSFDDLRSGSAELKEIYKIISNLLK